MTAPVIRLVTPSSIERDAAQADVVSVLERLLDEARAGHINAVFVATSQTDDHPQGSGFGLTFTTHFDLVHRLGALEILRADMIRKAGL